MQHPYPNRWEYFPIERPRYPIILTHLHFTKDGTQTPFSVVFMCDYTQLFLQDKGHFHFRTVPPHRPSCTVQVYINPVDCRFWKIFWNLDKIYLKIAFGRQHEIRYLPESFFDPSIDSNLVGENAASVKSNYILVQVQWELEYFVASAHFLFTMSRHWLEAGRYGSPTIFVAFPEQLILHLSNKSNKPIIVEKATQIMCQSSSVNFHYREINVSRLLVDSWRVLLQRRKLQSCALGNRDMPLMLQELNPLDTASNIEKHLSSRRFSGLSATSYITKWNQPWDDPYIEVTLIHLLFPNVSLLYQRSLGVWNLPPLPTIFNPVGLQAEWVMPGLTRVLKSNVVSEFVYSSKNEEMHFLSCRTFLEKGVLSFLGYVAAFDSKTWIVLTVASIISGNILRNNVKFPQANSLALRNYLRHPSMVFQDMFFVYAILLTQGYNGIHRCKWLCGAWILAGIFLSFHYQGSNIDSLTAPLVDKNVETFQQLIEQNFSITSEMSLTEGTLEVDAAPTWEVLYSFFRKSKNESFYSTSFNNVLRSQYTSFRNQFREKSMVEKVERLIRKLKPLKLTGTSFDEMLHGSRSLGFGFQIFIGTCLTKPAVYVETWETIIKNYNLISTFFKGGGNFFWEEFSQIAKDMDTWTERGDNIFSSEFSKVPEYLSKKRARKSKSNIRASLSIGKESLGRMYVNWKFTYIPWSPEVFLRRVRVLTESGLGIMLIEYRRYALNARSTQNLNETDQSGFEPVKLKDGNFVVVFFVYLMCISSTAFTVLYEVGVASRLLSGCVKFLSAFCKCFVIIKTLPCFQRLEKKVVAGRKKLVLVVQVEVVPCTQNLQ